MVPRSWESLFWEYGILCSAAVFWQCFRRRWALVATGPDSLLSHFRPNAEQSGSLGEQCELLFWSGYSQLQHAQRHLGKAGDLVGKDRETRGVHLGIYTDHHGVWSSPGCAEQQPIHTLGASSVAVHIPLAVQVITGSSECPGSKPPTSCSRPVTRHLSWKSLGRCALRAC